VKQTAVSIAELETTQNQHDRLLVDLQKKGCPHLDDIKEIKGREWRVVGATIMGLLSVVWQFLKIGK